MADAMHDDGGPAFPRPSGEAVDVEGNHFFPEAQSGMSLRDWFAGQAAIGYLAIHADGLPIPSADEVSKYAYRVADAMLAARGA